MSRVEPDAFPHEIVKERRFDDNSVPPVGFRVECSCVKVSEDGQYVSEWQCFECPSYSGKIFVKDMGSVPWTKFPGLQGSDYITVAVRQYKFTYMNIIPTEGRSLKEKQKFCLHAVEFGHLYRYYFGNKLFSVQQAALEAAWALPKALKTGSRYNDSSISYPFDSPLFNQREFEDNTPAPALTGTDEDPAPIYHATFIKAFERTDCYPILLLNSFTTRYSNQVASLEEANKHVPGAVAGYTALVKKKLQPMRTMRSDKEWFRWISRFESELNEARDRDLHRTPRIEEGTYLKPRPLVDRLLF